MRSHEGLSAGELHVRFAFQINYTRSWVGDEFEEGRPVRRLLWSVQVRNDEELGEWHCRHGGSGGR